nr:MAG: hypothetical protein [Hemigrapsus takanoi nimavirus]
MNRAMPTPREERGRSRDGIEGRPGPYSPPCHRHHRQEQYHRVPSPPFYHHRSHRQNHYHRVSLPPFYHHRDHRQNHYHRVDSSRVSPTPPFYYHHHEAVEARRRQERNNPEGRPSFSFETNPCKYPSLLYIPCKPLP